MLLPGEVYNNSVITQPLVEIHKKTRTISNIYEPKSNHEVIGWVTKIQFDRYILDINAEKSGELEFLQFQGSSKKSYPKFKIGDTVFCKIAKKDLNGLYQLTCKSKNKKGDWYTDKAYYKQLKGGVEIQLQNRTCLYLIKNNWIQKKIQDKIKFACIVGINGVAWIRCESLSNQNLI